MAKSTKPTKAPLDHKKTTPKVFFKPAPKLVLKLKVKPEVVEKVVEKDVKKDVEKVVEKVVKKVVDEAEMSKKVQKVPKLTDKVAPIALEVVEKDDEVKKVDTPEEKARKERNKKSYERQRNGKERKLRGGSSFTMRQKRDIYVKLNKVNNFILTLKQKEAFAKKFGRTVHQVDVVTQEWRRRARLADRIPVIRDGRARYPGHIKKPKEEKN